MAVGEHDRAVAKVSRYGRTPCHDRGDGERFSFAAQGQNLLKEVHSIYAINASATRQPIEHPCRSGFEGLQAACQLSLKLERHEASRADVAS
jgi:hypothetical protein